MEVKQSGSVLNQAIKKADRLFTDMHEAYKPAHMQKPNICPDTFALTL